jgi:DNA helicase IV
VRSALSFEGSIAVICADASAPAHEAALRDAGLLSMTPTSTEASDEDGRVTVLPATLAKGLEFDHVIVVEPDAIVRAEPRGRHRLYVVLTRAVSRLTILHTAPLPLP